MLEILASLTPIDYSHLARVVQAEASRNTFDEYCVAASVLNRVKSDKFPNTVSKVVYQSRAYEGIYYQQGRPDSSLVNLLQSEQGKSNIMHAYSLIGERTDFKGQTMLNYRVASEDPMCDPTGNFYHYYWQT